MNYEGIRSVRRLDEDLISIKINKNWAKLAFEGALPCSHVTSLTRRAHLIGIRDKYVDRVLAPFLARFYAPSRTPPRRSLMASL